MRIDGKRVLVTGGAGFIGSSLVRELLDRHCEVRVLDDFSAGKRGNLPERGQRLELVQGDIRDAASATTAVSGVDVVMHLACSCLRTSLYDPVESHEVNGGGTLAMVAAAAEEGVDRFLYCSSSEVYGTALTAPMTEAHPTHPTTVYGASKLAGEWYALSYLKTHDLAVTVARPFNTYGPREHHEGPHGEVIPKMTVRALNGRPPVIFGDGSQTRDFTFVDDTVRGLILAAETDELIGERINIAFGREVSIARIAELVCEAVGSDLEPEYTTARPADVDRHFADTTLAKGQMAFQAEVPIEDGIPAYVKWIRETYPSLEALLAEESGRNWVTPA